MRRGGTVKETQCHMMIAFGWGLALMLCYFLASTAVLSAGTVDPDNLSNRTRRPDMEESAGSIFPEIVYELDPVTNRMWPASIKWSRSHVPIEEGTLRSLRYDGHAAPTSSISRRLELARRFREDPGAMSGPCGVEDVLVVGDNPPNEIIIIDSDTLIVGDICIVNQGELRIEESDFTLIGDITIQQGGRMTVSGGSFTVPEEFRLQFNCLVMDSARFEIEGSRISFSGQNWGLTCVGNSYAGIDGCTFPSGIISGLLLQSATMEVSNCRKPGEFIPMENSTMTISNCDTVIAWCTFPVLSGGTFEAPGQDTLVSHWEFPTPSVTGVDYSFVIDSTSNVLTGLLCSETISLDIENSDIVALGLIFWEGTGDTALIKGLVDDMDYTDYTLDLEDRDMRLVNTHVGAWNLYPFDATLLRIENSIFGEIMTADSSRTEIYNSICDGSGGHVMTDRKSELITVFTTMIAQVISRNRSLMLSFGGSFPSSSISADGGSVIMLLNCSSMMRPVVKDTALVVEAFVGIPSSPAVDSRIPVTGTALMTPGPFNQLPMDHYLLETAAGVDPQTAEWTMIDSVAGSVFQDTLGVWNTHGLDPGYHMLQLTINSAYVDSFRFSIPTMIIAYLNESTGIETGGEDVSVPLVTALMQNAPNPFNPSTSIEFSVREEGPVRLEIYNIRGRRVRKLLDGRPGAGAHSVMWDGTSDKGDRLPSGVYFYRLELPEETFTRKMVLAK